MSGFRRTLLMTGLGGFAIAQTGCTSYKPIEPPDISGQEEIRVRLTSGVREDLRAPRQVADTLIGRRADGDTIRIPMVDIESISVANTDTWKTIALVAAVTVGGIAIAGLIYLVVGLATTDCIGLCPDE